MMASEPAAEAGAVASYLSNIETGKKTGSIKAMKRTAAVLRVTTAVDGGRPPCSAIARTLVWDETDCSGES